MHQTPAEVAGSSLNRHIQEKLECQALVEEEMTANIEDGDF
jgi:hypothetical protein